MNSSDLVKKARKYLHDEFADNNHCCEQHIVDWVEAVLVFRQKATNSCCINTLKSVQHFILSESSNGDYKARENSMFGDLNEVRNKGFEDRFMYNVKIHKTYQKAYQVTEKEYESNFGKRRYASYDSFRQVRSRRIKKNRKSKISRGIS